MDAPDDIDDRLHRLLEAHVAFHVRELRGAGFAALVEQEVAHALDRAGELTLHQVIDRTRVKEVAAKYVARFDLPGAIPEVAGEIATRLRVHPANDVQLGEVLPRQHVVAAAAKVAELRAVREWIAIQITESTAVQSWLAGYLRSLTTGAVESNLRLAKKVPGVSLGLSLGGKLAGGAVREADQRSREMAEQAAIAILARSRENILTSLTDADVEQALVEMWDSATDRSVRELLDSVADDDLVDAASILYDGWLDVRANAYLTALIDTGVDYFFDTYGEYPLDDLLKEFGLDRIDLVEEALRFAPGAIEALDEAGLLADLIRRQFARFYGSEEARAVFDER
ncbi:MAG TPA: hypothetical protein VGH43_03975 [Jatrophihabitans sp.]|jgi:hypothetical protein